MKKTLNKEKIKLLCMDLVMLVVLVLIDYYTKAGILKSVDGTVDMEDVFGAIVSILGE